MNNLMNQLPLDLEKLINSYLDYTAIMNKCINKINNIEYEIESGCFYSSIRTDKNGNETSYYSVYDLEDYINSVEDDFEHNELEIFSDINGWRKINNLGKETFYSYVC